MLRKALKLDKVHTFGDFSMSQIIEKMDFLAEIASTNDYQKSLLKRQWTFITIISLSRRGLLAETAQKSVY